MPYRLYSERSLVQIEWIDKLNRIGFSLPEIKSFSSDFKSMETAADLMEGLHLLYREKRRKLNNRFRIFNSWLKSCVSLSSLRKCKPLSVVCRPDRLRFLYRVWAYSSICTHFNRWCSRILTSFDPITFGRRLYYE